MLEGFFRVAFTGATGVGLGILVLRQGRVVGADAGAAVYDGSYTEIDAGSVVEFDVTMNIPAGVAPVQTGLALGSPISVPIKASIPLENIEKQIPTLVNMSLGPVNLILTKLRDL